MASWEKKVLRLNKQFAGSVVKKRLWFNKIIKGHIKMEGKGWRKRWLSTWEKERAEGGNLKTWKWVDS